MREPEYEIINGQSGLPTVRVRLPDGRAIMLHSNYDPVGEGEQMAALQDIGQAGVVIVFGCGLGYHLEAALRNCPEDSPVIIIERFPGLVSRTLEDRPHLQAKRAVVSTSEIPGIEAALDIVRPAFFRRRGAVVIEHPPSVSADPEFYRKAWERLRDSLSQLKLGANTSAKIGWLFARNFFENIPLLAQDPCVSRLFGMFKGVPAVLVASGPSLDKNIDLVKEAKGKAVIIAMGSAYEALHRRGIVPDLTVAVDPGETSNRSHFEGRGSDETALIYESKTYPGIPREFTGPRFSFFQDYPMARWLFKSIGSRSDFPMGLTVATSAFGVAARLGCNPKILVGQDFAFIQNQTHSAGIGIAKDFPIEAELTVPAAIGGGMVPTTHIFNSFRLALEGLYWQDTRAGGLVIDATEGGALKAHTQIMTLREAIGRYCTREAPALNQIREIWESGRSGRGVLIKTARAMRSLFRRLKKFRAKLYYGLVNIEELRRLLSAIEAPHMGSFHSSLARRAKEMFNTVWEENQEINRYPDLVNLLHLTASYMTFGREIKEMTVEQKIEENGAYYAEMLIGCDIILQPLEKSADILADILEETAGINQKAKAGRP